jgi:hypothetical protein
MPNGVKYSTTTPSGSLRKSNVVLGVTGDLGPTANTGFYSMPTPSSGKYIINKVAASGLPVFFAPQNDTELIQLARNEGATGADTGSAAAVLAWIATQANLEAANFQYENIVTDGLVLNVDAGFVGSYPTTGSTLYDISGNNYSGNLVNGPTVNSLGVTLDGTNDYIYLNHGGALSFTSGNYTILVWNRDNVDPTSSYGGIITNDNTGDNAWKIFKDVNQSRYRARSNSSQLDFPNYTVGQFQMYAFTFNAGTVTLYLDGSQTSQYTGITNPVGYSNIAWGSYRYGDAVIGQYLHPQTIGPTLLYNRALSSAEILQNYNAQKGRFGL